MQSNGRRLVGALGSPPSGREVLRFVLIAGPALGLATALVWLLEDRLGVLNASPVYLLAVVAVALVSGTTGALVAAATGILVYDFLFVHPVHTLEISDPGEWLNLALLLFVGVVVGQLTALERQRTVTAEAREREARELFLISRSLATRGSTTSALGDIAEQVRRACAMGSVWVALGADDAGERVAALAGEPPGAGTLQLSLRRAPGDEPARWIRVHAGSRGPQRDAPATRAATYRVRIEVGSRALGSIWATRPAAAGDPDRSATRLLSAAADQVGQALVQDEFGIEARAAEVARQSDALKSALLQSVSHDLRTPLATIRAAAGSLQPDSDLDEEDRRASASAIEREVERLDRLVANLLDLGRIESGALRADLDVFELDDLVGRVLDRLSTRLAGHQLDVEVPPIPVLVDPVFLDEAITNLLDNAVKFTAPAARIRVAATRTAESGGRATLVVEDDGPGVPADAMDRVFEAFYRAPAAPAAGRSLRPGTGIGLAVVRGLVRAMGGDVRAGPSSLGGLAVTLELPLATLPAELTTATATA